jgi:UDP-glucose 4-epimerase
MKKKVIVTGGAGFIGSHLVESLIKEDDISEIIIIDNFKDGNFKNINSLKKNFKIKIVKKDINTIKNNDKNFKNIDCVFHLAAIADIVPSIIKPLEYCYTNIIGTIKILEAIRYNKIKKIIFSASSSCYGIPKKYPTDELAKIDPQYPYAFSKYLGEQAIIHWSKIYKINYISLRLFNVYGTRSRTSSNYGAMFGVFLSQKIKQKPYTVVEDGNQLRDFLYVSDVVDAIVRAAKSKIYGEIFNVGSGSPVSVLDIVNLLKGKYVFIPKRPGEPDITHADIKKIKKYLQWKPKISIKKGINILLQNIDYWKSAPLWTPNNIKVATKDWFKYLK